MLSLAMEELSHFQRVHELILRRGFTLGRERKDDYVNQLLKFLKKGGSKSEGLADRLLLGAMIEARSCERFKMLASTIKDAELAEFYRELMASEAGHYATFIKLAKKFCQDVNIELRWSEWLKFEAQVIENYGVKVNMAIHNEVLNRYHKLNIAPYAGFINPKLIPVKQGDKIIDVKVEYPMGFTQQMLYLGKTYSEVKGRPLYIVSKVCDEEFNNVSLKDNRIAELKL